MLIISKNKFGLSPEIGIKCLQNYWVKITIAPIVGEPNPHLLLAEPVHLGQMALKWFLLVLWGS
jgi:hypothetical protein